jgi:hypothetical protein
MQSDLLQNTRRVRNKDDYNQKNWTRTKFNKDWPALASKLENRFDGWQKVFFNNALREAQRRNASYVYVPTSVYYEEKHSNAPFKYYDAIVQNYPHTTTSDGNWNVIDMKDSGQMLIAAMEDSLDKFANLVALSLDYHTWKIYIETYIKKFVEDQEQLTKGLESKEELAKDAYKFMLEAIPQNVQNDSDFKDILEAAVEELEDDGYGNILEEAQFKTPTQNPLETLNFGNRPDEDDEGAVHIDPSGQPMEPEKLQEGHGEEIYNPLRSLDFNRKDYEVEKQSMVNKYLDELSQAKRGGDQNKVNSIKKKLDELISLSSLSFKKESWQVETNEFYELERLLNNKHYSYHLEGNTFIIDHEGYVYLNSLTSLPDNIQFNNEGYVDLYSLTSLPDNIQFNNEGYVDLYSLTSLPDNIQFNNEGYVYLRSLTSLPNNVQFNNRGYVDLYSLTSLPNNKYDIFKNGGVVFYNHHNSQFNPKDREKLSWKEVEDAIPNVWSRGCKFSSPLDWRSGKDSWKNLEFNYDPSRGQQIHQYEPTHDEEQGNGALNSLDLQDLYYADNFKEPITIDKKDKEIESLDWTTRNNLQFGI